MKYKWVKKVHMVDSQLVFFSGPDEQGKANESIL